MTKDKNNYNYTFSNTGQIGQYIYTTCGDLDSAATCQSVNFMISPSGYNNILGLFITVISIVYGIAFIGYFYRNEWVSIIGGMAMIVLGLFTLNNGIDIFRNFMTESFSWITIGLGAFFSITAGVSVIENNL